MESEMTAEPAGVGTSTQKRADQTPPSAWQWLPRSWMLLLAALVVINLLYALPRYLQFDPALSRSFLDPSFSVHFEVLVIHAVTGNIALVAVFVQLIGWIRRNYPALHRMSGRVYIFAGALPAALTGLLLLPYSSAPMGKLGLMLMSTLWIVTTLIAFWMIRHGRYLEHRRWMLYSFAMALGTSWGRLISIVSTPGQDIDLAIFFDISSWLGWVVSLIIVHWYVERTNPRVAREFAARAA